MESKIYSTVFTFFIMQNTYYSRREKLNNQNFILQIG
jgi:hypothetical protein